MDNFFKDTPDFKFHLEHPIVKKIVKLKERNFKESEEYDYAPLNHEDAIDTYEKILEIVGEDCAETIYEFGSEEQRDKYLPRFNRDGVTAAMVLTEPDAGSDLQSVKLKATFDKENNTWILNGVKRF